MAQKYLLNCVLLGAIVLAMRWIAKFNCSHLLVLMSNPWLSAALPLLKQQTALSRKRVRDSGGILVLLGWPFLKVADEPQTVPD